MKGNYKHLFTAILAGLLAGAPSAMVSAQKSNKVAAEAKPTKEAPFMLKGFAKTFPDSTKVIVTSKNDQLFRGPSATVQNGQFLLQGKLPAPGIYNLLLTNPKHQEDSRYIDLFLANEPSAIEFTGNNGDFTVLEGNSLKAFSNLIQAFGNDFDSLGQLQQQKQTPGADMDKINQSWANVVTDVYNKVPGFIQEYKSSPVAPFLLLTIWPISSTQVNVVDGWMAMIDSSAMDNDFGAALKEYVTNEKMFGYGQPAPVFVQNDVNGKPVDLKTFRGKYVLIDFWASWCGPCRMENPNVVNAYNKFKDKNFTVLGVSLDRDKSKWLQAIQQDQLAWTQVSDLGFWNNAVAKLYKVQSIPQNFLLDPEGKIIGKNLRGESLDNFLYSVLGAE